LNQSLSDIGGYDHSIHSGTIEAPWMSCSTSLKRQEPVAQRARRSHVGLPSGPGVPRDASIEHLRERFQKDQATARLFAEARAISGG
jgi:hypothetical protein